MAIITRLAGRDIDPRLWATLSKSIAAASVGTPIEAPQPIQQPIPQPIQQPIPQPIQQPIPQPIQTPISTMPTVSSTMGIPPIGAPKPAIPQSAADRIKTLPQRGALGSTFQGGRVQKRFVADLPANVQLRGINTILSGQNSTNPLLNQYIRTLAAQGKTPEQIRQAFIAQQKKSSNPLVIL